MQNAKTLLNELLWARFRASSVNLFRSQATLLAWQHRGLDILDNVCYSNVVVKLKQGYSKVVHAQRRGSGVRKRRHFTVYWSEQEDGELMGKLKEVARQEKRSKSSTLLVALKEYVKRYFEDEEDDEEDQQ